jgi:D-amino-acid dehydrogenase
MTANGEQLPTVVIGAGVIGLSIAFRLARTVPDVVLIERGEPGMAASYGNAGHIATEQVFPLASPSTMLNAPKLMLSKNRPLSVRPGYAPKALPWLSRFAWASRPSSFRRGTAALASLQRKALSSLEALCADAGIPRHLHKRGHLILVESAANDGPARKQLAAMQEHGVDASWLEPEKVLDMAPELERCWGGIHVHDSAHVSEPLAVCHGLLEAFLSDDGRFDADEVQQIERIEHGRYRLTLRDGEFEAGRVVVCAGAWSRELARQVGFDVPLDTERGYHVQANGWQGSFDIAIASFDRMTIMTPLEGGLRITGFVEIGGLDLPPNPKRLATLNRHLSELLPNQDLSDRSEWMGFRPSMPDHLPVIGTSPDDPNLVFAFGHQHLGLTLAGVTADIVESLVTTGESDIDLAPFRVDRFQ